ncbi:hypothetical protein NEF87_000910 [Candidatus Lokiarchaeum ossiferum]|uniref:Uncharacterized protein n=1 Tax=Candidatus Lokiarchaeum ossiferum TaxID=2951803 RepID=A0ABY6HM88_9ARCH|nr:hypothetical protein NEF87_000910 [Candidatus Lokiarchaeum sp. B-35]
MCLYPKAYCVSSLIWDRSTRFSPSIWSEIRKKKNAWIPQLLEDFTPFPIFMQR